MARASRLRQKGTHTKDSHSRVFHATSCRALYKNKGRTDTGACMASTPEELVGYRAESPEPRSHDCQLVSRWREPPQSRLERSLDCLLAPADPPPLSAAVQSRSLVPVARPHIL